MRKLVWLTVLVYVLIPPLPSWAREYDQRLVEVARMTRDAVRQHYLRTNTMVSCLRTLDCTEKLEISFPAGVSVMAAAQANNTVVSSWTIIISHPLSSSGLLAIRYNFWKARPCESPDLPTA